MSKERQRGTSFESSLIPLLEKYQPGAHRLGMQGVKDKGDFWLPDPRYVLEAKNCKRVDLAGFVKEAEVEALNAAKAFGFVVMKRRGVTDPAKQYLLGTLGSFLELVHGATVR